MPSDGAHSAQLATPQLLPDYESPHMRIRHKLKVKMRFGFGTSPLATNAGVQSIVMCVPVRFSEAPASEALAQASPLVFPPTARSYVPAAGAAAAALRRRYGSIYGPAGPVLAAGEALAAAGHRSRSVRPDQPLLVLGTAGGIDPNPSVVQAQPRDFARVLPASAAMFEEELGFSPFTGGAAQYRDRVERLIHAGRVFIDPGPRDAGGPLRFKADIGLLSSRCAQIQGVWMAPAARGRGLAVSAMAAVVDYVRLQAPVVSLYVNAYNTPALRAYERVGFERRGTFATVLY